MIASSYVQQTAWGWQIAAYLFLGGLGGAVGALGIGIERFVNQDGRIGFVSALSGFVLLAVGSLLLVLDLLRPVRLPISALVGHDHVIARIGNGRYLVAPGVP